MLYITKHYLPLLFLVNPLNKIDGMIIRTTTTASGDFVGEGLGGNSGVNAEASIIDRINLFNAIKLITSDSPHSSYKPTDYPELQDVTGYKK
jgi:hypothetical protein